MQSKSCQWAGHSCRITLTKSSICQYSWHKKYLYFVSDEITTGNRHQGKQVLQVTGIHSLHRTSTYYFCSENRICTSVHWRSAWSPAGKAVVMGESCVPSELSRLRSRHSTAQQVTPLQRALKAAPFTLYCWAAFQVHKTKNRINPKWSIYEEQENSNDNLWSFSSALRCFSLRKLLLHFYCKANKLQKSQKKMDINQDPGW